MANLWSHYLSKRRCPPQPLILFIWSSSLPVSVQAVLAAETGNRCEGSMDVCTPTGTRLAQFAFYSGPFPLPRDALFSVLQFPDYDGLVKWTVNDKRQCFHSRNA